MVTRTEESMPRTVAMAEATVEVMPEASTAIFGRVDSRRERKASRASSAAVKSALTESRAAPAE